MPVDNRMVVLTTADANTTAEDATALIASSGANNILIGELAINSNTGNFYAGCEVGETGASIGGSAGKSTATSDILGMTLSSAATMQAVGTGASPTFTDLTLSGGDITIGAAAVAGTMTVVDSAADAVGNALTITGSDVTAGSGTGNTAGGAINIVGGKGTGTGGGGSIVLKTSAAGSSGNSATATPAAALTLAADKSATFAGAVTGITDLTITGDLNITGDVNSTSVTDLDVTDKTITIAKGAGSSSAADGAGIVVDGASASILYDHTGTQWEFNKPVSLESTLEVDSTSQFDGAITVGVDDTGADVKMFGATSGSYWLWDESADGVTQVGTLTVGVDDAGHDVKFFGNAASAYMLWDASADDLVLAGAAGLTVAGTNSFAGNTTHTGTLTTGVDDTGVDVKFFGATSGSYWLWDESADKVVTVGDYQQTGTMTVGVDNTGHDVKFFGATSGAYMLWDESADDLTLAGAAGIVCNGNIDLEGDIDVNGTTNLDAVDIDGAVQADSTITVGVDNTGYDVKFFGATSGSYWLWDESADKVVTVGDYQQTGTMTVGVDDAGHDVKFFGDTAGDYMLWDTSANKLMVEGDCEVTGTLTATVANATNAANVYITEDNTGDTSCSIIFTQDAGGANRALYEDSGLLYNNTTNYITCGGLTAATISGGTF